MFGGVSSDVFGSIISLGINCEMAQTKSVDSLIFFCKAGSVELMGSELFDLVLSIPIELAELSFDMCPSPCFPSTGIEGEEFEEPFVRDCSYFSRRFNKAEDVSFVFLLPASFY